ncbi:MAG: hypothetical protein JWM02_1017 [Frankiales bacterium]|nr:hypothetical protein [Frankiales bacterium]
MAAKRSLALLIVTATFAAVATPALAATSVPVTLVGLGGTRQFAVEDITGSALTALNLGTGGTQPFRTHVTDSSFLPTAAGGNYDVFATLSNLYLKTGPGNTASDYNYNVKVPSSAVSVVYGNQPLGIAGLSVADLPKLSLSGTMSSCSGLSSPLKSILGLSILGVVLGSNSALTNLCSTLGVSGAPVTATVDAALQTVTSTVTDLTKLPTALSGATGGTFTNPSFASGVGAFDTAGAASAAGAVASSLPLMKGVTGSNLNATFATDLLAQLTGQLTGPLTSATGVGSLTQLSALTSVLQSAGAPVLSQLGAVLNTLTSADQSTLLNSVFTSITPSLPVIGDLQGITGSAYAFPTLKATAPNTPVPGTYGGTMTVTFVQS